MKYFGRWLLGIVIVMIALTFMLIILLNIRKRVSVQRRSADSFYDHQYQENQESIEDDQIIDTFPEVSNDMEQFDENNVHFTLSQSYNEKLIEGIFCIINLFHLKICIEINFITKHK